MNGIQLIFISVVILLVMLTQNVNAETSFSKQQNQLSSDGLHSINDHYKMIQNFNFAWFFYTYYFRGFIEKFFKLIFNVI